MSATYAWAPIAIGLLADSALKGAVVVAAGAGAAWLLRRSSAANRHAVWASTLGVVAALPVATWLTRGTDVALGTPGDAMTAVVGLWAVGALARLLPVGAGYLALRRVARRGETVGQRGRTLLVRSAPTRSPLTFGAMHPVVLLPTAMGSWDRELQRAVETHELAHVERQDWLVHMATQVVLALAWFHPMVWFAARQLGLEAERAADDRALSTGIAPSRYAQALLTLRTAGHPVGALAASGACLPLRIRSVLAAGAHRGRRRWPVFALAAGLSGVALVPLSGAAVWSTPEPPVVLHCNPTLAP
jgi:beta-lactamase regulating signal transducer with metallopeptidase domain